MVDVPATTEWEETGKMSAAAAAKTVGNTEVAEVKEAKTIPLPRLHVDEGTVKTVGLDKDTNKTTDDDRLSAEVPAPGLFDIVSETEDGEIASLSPAHHSGRRLRFVSHERQDSTRFFGGFGDLNREVKLHRKIGASIKDGKYETLDNLAEESLSRVKHVRESEIRFEARKKSMRQTFTASIVMLICYFVAGVSFSVRVGGHAIESAFLYCVYTMTSTGFGNVQQPLTSTSSFFLVFLMFFGMACVTLLASQVYLYISLEASSIKRNLDKTRALHRDRSNDASMKCNPAGILQKAAELALSCAARLANGVSESEWVRFGVVVGYLCLLLLLGTFAMMGFEGWNFLESLYFASFCMSTMGYGDLTPVTRGGTWFVVAWLPLNVTFVSIYMGNLARYFMMAGSAYTQRVYQKDIAVNSECNCDSLMALRDEAAERIHDSQTDQHAIRTMQDVIQLVLENFAYSDDEVGEPSLRKQLQLQSSWKKSGVFFSNKKRQPSFSLVVLVQERLINILTQEVIVSDNNYAEKDKSFVFSIDGIDDIARKWKIPDGARDAFTLVVFESFAYLGEKRCVIEDAHAFLSLTPFECHQLLSPFLVALEDAGTMEGWLALTEQPASTFTSNTTYSMLVSSKKKAVMVGSDSKDGSPLAEVNGRILLAHCTSHWDVVLLAKLRRQYNRSLEEQQTMYLSKHRANRTVALWVFLCYLLYEVFATLFIFKGADVRLDQATVFTMYTVTTAGFGSVPVPKTTGFLVFLIFNIFISVSGVAVLVAQAFVYLESVALAKEQENKKRRMASDGMRTIALLLKDAESNEITVRDAMRLELSKSFLLVHRTSQTERGEEEPRIAKLKTFLIGTDSGRALCVAITMVVLLLTGTISTMITEEWTFPEGLYFSSYAMLTVGHGDLAPTTTVGNWIVTFWLPFNILFVSLYLGSIAHIFVKLSNANVARIEKKLMEEEEMRKLDNQQSTEEAGATDECIGNETRLTRRIRIKQNSTNRMVLSNVSTVRDLLKRLHEPLSPSRHDSDTDVGTAENESASLDNLPLRCRELFRQESTASNFKLRLAVMDRVARIVSANLVDFDGLLEVDGRRLRLTVESLKNWITKWKIPHRARQAYRMLAFECLLFVGEKQVFEKGVGAIFDLSIVEFVELFSPFVFALQDNERMEQWLEDTADMAMEFLPLGLEDDHQSAVGASIQRDRRTLKNTIENYFPCNPGNAVRIQL